MDDSGKHSAFFSWVIGCLDNLGPFTQSELLFLLIKVKNV